jgi:phosphoribosyl 1,2-cyclic phosphodiesterase
METIAPDVHRIGLLPGATLNAYLLRDVLVDAGLGRSARTILEAVGGRSVSEHVATHAHIDHVGGSAELIDTLALSGLGIGAGDAEAVRTGRPAPKPGRLGSVIARFGRFAPSQVIRELREGDEVGPGFRVIDAPGHTPGRSSFGGRRIGSSSAAMSSITSAESWNHPDRSTSTPGSTGSRRAGSQHSSRPRWPSATEGCSATRDYINQKERT